MGVSMMGKIRQRMIRQNRIYILPTARGVLFFAAIVILVLSAATYNNNLIFILAFFLFSLFAVTMVQTHYNIKGVGLEFLSAEEVFEGDHLALLFNVVQKRQRPKRGLRVRSVARDFKTHQHGALSLLSRDREKAVRVTVFAQRRGVHRLPEMTLETFFPLGLFRAWKIFRPQGQLIVYPKPEGERALEPSTSELGEEDLGLRASPEGDFGELKAYQTGESYHQIAWKHYARTGDLYSKVHWGEEHHHYRIPWAPLGKDHEGQLRQMSLWVKKAVNENATFEMELPRARIQAGAGIEAARLCWRALARFKDAV